MDMIDLCIDNWLWKGYTTISPIYKFSISPRFKQLTYRGIVSHIFTQDLSLIIGGTTITKEKKTK